MRFSPSSTPKTTRCRPRWLPPSTRSPAWSTRWSTGSERAVVSSTSARARRAGSACSTRPSARRPTARRPRWCRASSPAAAKPSRTRSRAPRTTRAPVAGRSTSGGLGPADVLVGITASGQAPYVIGAMKRARERGATVAALSCNKGSRTFEHADHAILVDVGPEIVSGSTRMKSGTAQKLVLNMITTAAMIRMGKVYNNLMVDLRPVNSKLIRRSQAPDPPRHRLRGGGGRARLRGVGPQAQDRHRHGAAWIEPRRGRPAPRSERRQDRSRGGEVQGRSKMKVTALLVLALALATGASFGGPVGGQVRHAGGRAHDHLCGPRHAHAADRLDGDPRRPGEPLRRLREDAQGGPDPRTLTSTATTSTPRPSRRSARPGPRSSPAPTRPPRSTARG